MICISDCSGLNCQCLDAFSAKLLRAAVCEKRKLLEQETDMKAMREVSLCLFTVSVVCL